MVHWPEVNIMIDIIRNYFPRLMSEHLLYSDGLTLVLFCWLNVVIILTAEHAYCSDLGFSLYVQCINDIIYLMYDSNQSHSTAPFNEPPAFITLKVMAVIELLGSETVV